MNQTCKKILVTCFDNVGDLVFISSVTANLKQSYPDSEIHVVCKEYTGQLAKLLPGVTKSFQADPYWDKSPLRPKGSLRHFLKTWWMLRQEKYDVVVVTGACWRSAFYSRLAGIPIRVGYDRRKVRWFLNKTVPMFSRDTGVVNELLRLLPPIGGETKVPHYQLLEPKSPQVTSPEIPFIAMHPFAGHPRRCASLDFWNKLGNELKAKGHKVIWVGAQHELERFRKSFAYNDDEFIQHYMKEDNLFNVASFVKNSKLFIGHDSGPLHVAGALDVKTLGFYLPSEYKRTFPQGPGTSRWIVESSPNDLKLEDVLSNVDALT